MDVVGAVIVTLFTEVAVAAPKVGVTKVGLVAKTNAPVPVSSETTPASSAEVVAAKALILSVVTTNVFEEGHSGSEGDVREHLVELIKKCPI